MNGKEPLKRKLLYVTAPISERDIHYKDYYTDNG